MEVKDGELKTDIDINEGRIFWESSVENSKTDFHHDSVKLQVLFEAECHFSDFKYRVRINI